MTSDYAFFSVCIFALLLVSFISAEKYAVALPKFGRPVILIAAGAIGYYIVYENYKNDDIVIHSILFFVIYAALFSLRLISGARQRKSMGTKFGPKRDYL